MQMFVVQVRFSEGLELELEVLYNRNDITQNVTNVGSTFNDLEVQVTRANTSSVMTTFQNGVSVIVTATRSILNIRMTLPQGFSSLTKGLMGNFNDDNTDDFVYFNGTMLSNNASDSMIHQFGQSCKFLCVCIVNCMVSKLYCINFSFSTNNLEL